MSKTEIKIMKIIAILMLALSYYLAWHWYGFELVLVITLALYANKLSEVK